MRLTVLLSTTPWIVFSFAVLLALALPQGNRSGQPGGAAYAMGGPVYVDSVCDVIREAKSTPALKRWLKAQCPRGEASSAPICADLAPFVRDVTANNENWRAKCGAGQ